MGKDYYLADLRSSREDALKAIDLIAADLKIYSKSRHKDAQIIFALNVLTAISQNCRDLNEKAYYDIYVDIFISVLSPNLDPTASRSYWNRLLPLLQYFFFKMSFYEFHKEAKLLYTFIYSRKETWQDFENAKYLLQIHSSYINLQCSQLNSTSSNAEDIHLQIKNAIGGLVTVFEQLKKHENESPAALTTLLMQFPGLLISNTPANQIHFATTLRTVELEQMYNVYFDLLSASAEIESEDIETVFSIFQKHLETFKVFIKLDVYSKLEQQVALKYIKIFRNMKIFQQNQYICYVCALLCNFLKLAYLRTPMESFKAAYTQLSSRFITLLRESGKVLTKQTWFQDFLMLMYLLFGHMQPNSSNIFQKYWQHMEIVYENHFELITSCFELFPFVLDSKIIEYKCCKNKQDSWRHNQLGLTHVTVETYSWYIKQLSNDPEKITSFTGVHRNMKFMLKASIDNLCALDNNCTKATLEFRKFSYSIASLMSASNHVSHARFCKSLVEEVTRLKNRISTEDWLMILRRIWKVEILCEDWDSVLTTYSCYIAELLKNSKHPPFIDFQHHLNYFYSTVSTELMKRGTCLFEIYKNSTSPFKTFLQKNEKRLFHWLEMQHLQRYYDCIEYRTIFEPLAKCCQTKYDLINAVHAGKLLDSEFFSTKIENIYDVLRNNKMGENNSSLTRFEELTFAHAACSLHRHRCEKLKTNLKTKEFSEENLEMLILNKSLVQLNVNNEMKMVEKAVESLRAFENFYKKADADPLPSYESDYLDWSRILEDIVSLALYFQGTGYLDYALDAWLLHYRISSTIDDHLSSFRSLAFFCEHSFLMENHCITLDFENEITIKSKCLCTILDNLPQHLRRQQNFILTCICQMAFYYGTRNDFQNASRLLKLVYYNHKKLDREDKYDIVLFTADVVQFRIEWLYLSKSPLQAKNFCLLHEIDVIMERMRSYVPISIADTMPYTLLLVSTICDFAECTGNRLWESFLGGYMCSVLKLMVDMGAAMKSVQILLKWTYINLQTEYLQKAKIKLLLIDSILGLRTSDELESFLKAVKSCAATSKEHHDYDSQYLLPVDVDEIRKCKMPSPSLIKDKHLMNAALFKSKLGFYLKDNSNNTNIEKQRPLNDFVLWGRTAAGCLWVRHNFLANHLEDIESFFDKSLNWQEERRHTFYYKIFHTSIVLNMIHFANFLRKTQKLKRAISHLEQCVSRCSEWINQLDPIYIFNLKLQLQNTKLELLENENRCLPSRKQAVRQLDFDISPEDYLTPANKLSKSKTMPTVPAFTIFSDKKHLRKAFQGLKKTPLPMKGLDFCYSSDSGSGSDFSSKKKIDTKRPPLNLCHSSDSGSGSDPLSKSEMDANICQLIEISDSEVDHYEKRERSEYSKPKQSLKLKPLESSQKEEYIKSTSSDVDDYNEKEKNEILKPKQFRKFKHMELEEYNESTSPPKSTKSKKTTKKQTTKITKEEKLLNKQFEMLAVETKVEATTSKTCLRNTKSRNNLETMLSVPVNLFKSSIQPTTSAEIKLDLVLRKNYKQTKFQAVESTTSTSTTTTPKLHDVKDSTKPSRSRSFRTRPTRAQSVDTLLATQPTRGTSTQRGQRK